MSQKSFRRSLTLLFLVLAPCAFAQITFTFNYTPSTTQYGLTASQPAQWTWTVDTAPAASLAAGFNWGTNITWEFSGQGAQHLWSSVQGTGLGGALDISKIGTSYYAMGDDGRNYLIVEAVSGQTLGLTFDTYSVSGLRMYARPAGLAPSMSPPSTALATYLGNYLGTYAVTETSATMLIFKTIGGGDIYLTSADLNGVTIANTPIPEPSTYAALAGVCALGLVAWRRRQAKRAD